MREPAPRSSVGRKRSMAVKRESRVGLARGRTPLGSSLLFVRAAGVGFEPAGDLLAASGFQDRPVRPLRHPAEPHCRGGGLCSPPRPGGRVGGARRRIEDNARPAGTGVCLAGARGARAAGGRGNAPASGRLEERSARVAALWEELGERSTELASQQADLAEREQALAAAAEGLRLREGLVQDAEARLRRGVASSSSSRPCAPR